MHACLCAECVCVCVCARACVCVYVCVWNTNVPHDHNKYKTKTYSLAVWGHQVCAWNQPLKKKINVTYFRQNSLQWVSLLRKIQPQFTQPDNITHSAEPKMYNKQNKTAEIWLKIKWILHKKQVHHLCRCCDHQHHYLNASEFSPKCITRICSIKSSTDMCNTVVPNMSAQHRRTLLHIITCATQKPGNKPHPWSKPTSLTTSLITIPGHKPHPWSQTILGHKPHPWSQAIPGHNPHSWSQTTPLATTHTPDPKPSLATTHTPDHKPSLATTHTPDHKPSLATTHTPDHKPHPWPQAIPLITNYP